MSDGTHIEWTDATWSVVSGCTRTSEGCQRCYIDRTPPLRMARRRFDGDHIGATTGVMLHPERFAVPLSWRKPRKVFVCSLADLFHDEVPDEHIASTFAVMALAPQHTFQVLTKRHARLRALLSSDAFTARVADIAYLMAFGEHPRVTGRAEAAARRTYLSWESVFPSPSVVGALPWPLPNVHVGVSVESQKWTIRLDALRETPAVVRWVSAEPLLSGLDLTAHLSWLSWVVAGGESGPGARPAHPDWFRSLRDQCAATGVPYLFKQRGEWTWSEPGAFRLPSRPLTDRVAVMHPGGMVALTKSNPFDPFAVHHPNWATRIERVGKGRAGRELDGRTHDEYPAAVTL